MHHFVIDTNVFIDAADTMYPLDVFPTFWKILCQLCQQGQVVSIDAVLDELKVQNDTLAQWAQTHFTGWRRAKYNCQVRQQYSQVIGYVSGLKDKPTAEKMAFGSGADGWLLAYALTYGAIVVTHEQMVDQNSKKIKIPNVCQHFGVKCISLIGMLRQLQVQI